LRGARNVFKTGILKSGFDRPAILGYLRSCLVSLLSQKRRRGTLKNIFVGNLDFGATESSLRALFEVHGAVDRVSLVTDRDTGRSRGFAFVEMTDSAQADNAIAALNGYEVEGRALNVNEARPKTGGSGGGRGGPRNDGGRQRREPRW
jgi:RNA recognition motif-containing protein